MPRELRFGIFTLLMLAIFDILNPRAGDVGAKKSNGKIWTQYNFRMCTAAPSPKRKSGGGEGRTLPRLIR